MAVRRRPMLVGTPAEHERVLAIARAAVERHPRSGRVLDGVLARLARATADLRERDRTAAAAPPVPAPAPPPTPTWLVLFGSTASVLMILAACLAGIVELPTKRGNFLTRDVGLMLSAVEAGVAAVLALLGGAALTRTRDADPRTWTFYLAAAAPLLFGLTWGARRAADDRAAYGATWTAWLVANVLAVAVLLVVALLLRRRATAASARPRVPDRDRDHGEAMAAALNTARAEVDTLLLAPERRARVVDDAWRAGLDEARRRGEISVEVAADARSTTPYRWQVEMAAVADE